MTIPHAAIALRRRSAGPVACGLLALALGAAVAPARAASPPPFAAHAGLDLAAAAARSWTPDAVLIYLENDEDVDAQGSAPRWGYLFFSPTQHKSRAYSVRDGRIVVAEDLGMTFEAPPIAEGWIDSREATAAASSAASHALHGAPGRLSSMLLMRGAFDDANPDRTTWTLVYTSPEGPSLFVVVDAVDGKVRRTWRG